MMHLSEEQIAQWIAGEGNAQTESHLAECGQCRAAVSGFEQLLRDFRSSSRAGAFDSPPRLDVRSSHSVWWPRIAAAVAALALLVAVPLYRERRAREQALIAQQDAQLLQQVDAEISQAVPDAMDPLVKVISQSNEEQK